MGRSTPIGNPTYDAAVSVLEGVRQGTVAAAAGNQVTVRNAEIAFYRGQIVAADGSVNAAAAYAALKSLGVNS